MPPSSRLPPRLRPGDVIGLLTPSFPILGAAEKALESGRQALEERGFRVRLGPHVRAATGYLAGSDAERARELAELFADPQVRCILATQGGSNANRLLAHLDWPVIEGSPTILCGHSDMTVLNLAVHARTGQVTCDGPNLVPQWGLDPQPYTDDVFLRVCGKAEPVGPLPRPDYLVHSVSYDLEANRASRTPHPGWRWLRPGQARGPLVGGHLASTLLLAGTPYWPDFEGRIWFWEELGGSLRWLDRYLTHARDAGVLDRIAGMVVGHCLIDPEPVVRTTLDDLLREHTAAYSFPVLMQVDCGHLNPRLTLPNGVEAVLDSEADRFELAGAAVAAA